ncbi:MAG: hypothetical protein BroJett011_16670 [Chloroflexota bacterium]|nr:MAG: hypothetical protein BroJett011_16670 [Chloroflexota bacterium]
MTKQNQKAENQADKKNQKVEPPAAATDFAGKVTDLTQLPGDLLAAGSSSIENQATHLANKRLQTVQRQAIAAQIGRVQGNQHLQRIVGSYWASSRPIAARQSHPAESTTEEVLGESFAGGRPLSMAGAGSPGNNSPKSTANPGRRSQGGSPLLTPQITQGAAPMIARWPIMGPISSGSSSSPEPSPGGTAEAYVKKHGKGIIQELHIFMSKTNIPLDVPHVSWHGSGNAGFNGQFCLQFFMKRDDPWEFIVSTTAGADTSYNIDYLIDKARDRSTIPDRALDWNFGVVLELANLYLRLLTASLGRVVPRWVLVWNQNMLAEERRLKTEGKQERPDPYKRLPPYETVRSSHPIDQYVIRALGDHLAVDFAAYRKANPAEACEHDIGESKLRSVMLQIQPKQLNWVRVIQPDKATAEEVANELYGSETMAYLIIAAPPLFGFQMGPDEWPKLKQGYREQIKSLYSGPFHSGTDAPLIKGPEGQLAGPFGEEAALNQAADVKPKADVNREAVIERMRLIVGEFAWLKDLVKKWSLDGQLEPARQKVDERSKVVAADKGPDTAMSWAGQTEVQLEVLGMVRNAVIIATNVEKQFAGFPATAFIINKLVWDYVDAAACSDLAATAKAKLAHAEMRSKIFPADVMDAVLEQLRPVIHQAMIEKTGKSGVSDTKGSYAPARYGAYKLAEREAQLRKTLARVREVLLTEPDKAKAELDQVLKELSDLATEVTFVSNMDNCEAAWQALQENLTKVGEIRAAANSLWGDVDANDLLREDQRAVTRMHEQWKAIYLRWKAAATPDEKQKIEDELHEKAKSKEWTELFAQIGRHIEDQQTWNAYVTFGIMVGIAIVTGGLGAYVEAFAGAAWGAAAGFGVATVVEATAFTAMSTALITTDPTLAGFVDEMGKSVLMFGGLKAIGKIYTAAVGEVAAASTMGKLGGITTQFVAINGVALYEADKAKREKTGGKEGLTEKEVMDISLGNLAFIAAVALGGRMAQPFLAKVTLRGQIYGELVNVRRARAAAGRLAKKLEASKGKGVSRAELERLLELNNKALEKEAQFLENLQARLELAEAGKESGLNLKDIAEIKRMMGEHEANRIELLRQEIAMSLETQTPNSFLCSEGMLPRIIDYYTNVEKVPVRQVGEPDALTGARTIEVSPKDQTPFRITERVSKPVTTDTKGAQGGKPRIDKPVEGLYEGVDPQHKIADWEFKDSRPEPDPEYPGFIRVLTQVSGPSKDGKGVETGWMERSYNPATKTLLMKNAFLEELANKIEHPGTTMLGPGKGTPLVTYLTMRQMKILGVDYAAPVTVKMTTIQNVKAVIELAHLMKQGMTADEAIVKTHSYQYGSTSIIQSGMTIVKARVGGDIAPKRLGHLLEWFESANGQRPVDQKVVDKHEALLKDVGKGQVSRDDPVLWNYDIIIDVKPFSGGP